MEVIELWRTEGNIITLGYAYLNLVSQQLPDDQKQIEGD